MNSSIYLSNVTSEFKRSIKLALPLIASEIIFSLTSFTATIMIAHLGKNELAANALVWSIYIAAILFFVGILFAISIMVAQSFGAKDDLGISICFKQGLIMAIIFSIPMTFIMWLSPTLLTWAKQDPQVIACAKPFFYSLVLSMLPLNILIAIEQFLVGITRTRLVMLIGILAVPIQIFFYYGFLFGKFGLPKTNLSGIGIGLAISNYLVAIFFICYLCFATSLKKYNLFKKWWVIDKKFLHEIFRVGLPLGLMWFSEVTFFAVVAIMMGTLGVAALAAFQIADQYLMPPLVILFALGQTASIRIGFEVGRDDREKLKLTAAVNITIGLILISIISLFYTILPELAISLDIDMDSKHYQDVAKEALKFFPLIAPLLIVYCIRLVSDGALRGLKDTNFQLATSISGLWLIAFPIAYLLAFKFGFGGVGIWWGTIIGLFVTSIVLLLRFNKLTNTLNLSSLVTKE